MRPRAAASILILTIAAIVILRGQVMAAPIPFDLSSDLSARHASVAEVAGSVMPRDVDTGTPSLKSDRLIIQLSGVETPPAGFALHCYLLKDEAGVSCGELAVAGGVINTSRDYPGNNLVGSYDTVRMVWEKPLFENTLPPAALALIREVVDRAAATPGQKGYGVGLVDQAELMATHANLARAAASAGNLAGAKVHAEHVLNILYGASDPRYGDHDGSGTAENPGDGFGILPYAANIELNMLEAAESVDVTDHIADQAIAAGAVIANFAPAAGGGTWSDELITKAGQIQSAGSAAAALPFATEMLGLARRILDGVDANTNGTVEAIAGEGGAWTAFFTVQRAADYFPSGGINGVIQHKPVGGDATSDQVTIALSNVPQPPENFGLWGYLVAPNGDRLVLGELPWNTGAVSVTLSYGGRNLIGDFDTFRLVQAAVYAEDTLPVAPLIPIRKVLALAEDTPGQVGYGVGLVQQAQILQTHAGQIGAAVSANNLALAKQRAAEALNVLVGSSDPRYDDAVADPGDGFGVLGYAGQVDVAMQQAFAAPGATDNIKQRSGEARDAIANFSPATGSGTWADQLITQLQQVLAAGSIGAATAPANQAAVLAGQILNGEGSEAGARGAYLASQQAADYLPKEAGAIGPDEPPVPGVNMDTFENDDICSRAELITTDGAPQDHTFHYEGDQDWVRFNAQANKSYVIEITGAGNLADPVISLFDACEAPPASSDSNAFGNTVRLVWNATKNVTHYLQVWQFDPTRFGEETEYTVKITLDTVPPSAPSDLRCIAINETTLGLQWRRSPEADVVAYRVAYGNDTATDTGVRDVEGVDTTFVELNELTPGELYRLEVIALDFSHNESAPSGKLPCRPAEPEDKTKPVLSTLQPSLSAVYTTTAPALTFSGTAQDPGENLSRALVHNISTHEDKSDFSLAGATAQFRVEDIPLRLGSNQIRITLFDEANNSTVHNLEVQRLGQVAGGVLIVAGHNETFGLQTNIYNAANRAYRIFQSAGYDHDSIYYIAPVGQDADGDGTSDVDATSSPAAIQNAITNWAGEGGRVGPDKPFFVYMIDHGILEKFCASGCDAAQAVTPADVDGWLRQLEEDTGVTDVTVVIEACQSGSFMDRVDGDVANSLSKEGRVIITSTGRENNAYASAQGAYFSDAFFSCVADSNNLKACFDEGVDAVESMGVDQTPWLDDNGDGVFNNSDGTLAQAKVVTRFFSSVRPRINNVTLDRNGANGTLSARVDEGAEELALVWAAVFPPSFEEPSDVTLNLNVPTVRLEADSSEEGRYSFTYTNGFAEEGDYRIIFYAQDRLGLHAVPKVEGEPDLFLPNVSNNEPD